MKYIIKSSNFTLGKQGEVIEDKAFKAAGLNIDALIEAGHIAKESASIKEKQTEGDAE